MSLDRTIILNTPQQCQQVAALISGNWLEMHSAGHPLAVRIYEHKDRRTLEQQSLMWIRLGEVAVQAWVGGRQYADVTWHEHCKREFLPDEDGPTKRCRKGYRKWDINPMTGERVLIGSTTQLTTFGMSEYMTQLEAWGSGELGVRFSATPREAA